MLSAILTLMVDSLATSLYSKQNKGGIVNPEGAAGAAAAQGDQEMGAGNLHGHHHGSISMKNGVEGAQLLRYRVIAMVSFSIHQIFS